MRILLVEDDPNLRRVLTYHLERGGHLVIQAEEGERALRTLDAEPVDLVLTDVRMSGMGGMELLRAVRARNIDLPVVVMTAYGTIGDAVEAMKQGASDYLTKPVDRETLLLAVQKAARIGLLAKENRRLQKTLRENRPLEAILGTSPAILDVQERLRRVAPSEATVLITGESGTGKELAARAIHRLSSRASGPFVPVNCAAVPKDLLESELFGHERGAFTGATETRPGKFQQAQGGTLFLDEVGDMDLALQSKILRVLQERVVDPVGSRGPVAVDARLLAATNRDLATALQEGSFREDLFWRLNVIPLRMPPLRERRGDILLLMKHFYRSSGGGDLELTPEAEAFLVETHPWPGNVRELQNLCLRLAVLHPGARAGMDFLPPEMRAAEGASAAAGLGDGLWGLEREAILRALREAGGNRSAAARALKIPRHVLLYRIKKYGLPPD